MKTKIYSVACDLDRFRTLMHADISKDTGNYPITIDTPKGPNTIDRETFDLDWGQPMPNNWMPVPLYCPDPNAQIPNFWSVPGYYIAADPEAYECVQDHYLKSGQVLNLPYKEKKIDINLKLLNILSMPECLDQSACKWREEDRGPIKRIDWQADDCLVFRKDRLGESPIFSPGPINSCFLCVERDGDPSKEFKAAVEENNLKGLEFTLRWEG